MCERKSTSHFLRRQHPFPEKAIWDLHESTRNTVAPRAASMASCHLLDSLAICLQKCDLPPQTLPILDDGTSRLELFSSIRVGMKLRHMHTFGCPVFALQNKLSSGGTIPHWSPCARLGINLIPTPDRACNIYLILNLHMGCVSLQFHCRFDDYYKTVKHGGPDVSAPSVWQQLAGLVTAIQRPSMEFHDKSLNQFQHISCNDAVSSSSNASAVPDDVFVDFFHEYGSESIATVPKTLQVSNTSPQEDASIFPHISLAAGTS